MSTAKSYLDCGYYESRMNGGMCIVAVSQSSNVFAPKQNYVSQR